MTKKRLEDILWERDNAPEKFKANAHEYFNEALPILEASHLKHEEKHEEKKEEVKKKYK